MTKYQTLEPKPHIYVWFHLFVSTENPYPSVLHWGREKNSRGLHLNRVFRELMSIKRVMKRNFKKLTQTKSLVGCTIITFACTFPWEPQLSWPPPPPHTHPISICFPFNNNYINVSFFLSKMVARKSTSLCLIQHILFSLLFFGF